MANQSELTIRFAGNYRKESGATVFRFTIHGKQEDLDRYKTLVKDNYREDADKNPLYFTTRFPGEKAKLLITDNDKIVVDTSEFEKLNSLSQQYQGTPLGEAIARQGAAQLLGKKQEHAEEEI